MRLLDKIKSEITKSGYISVKRYMEICLFDEDHGYYINKYPIGSDGDFITAPEISQMFGEIIALYIINQINSHLHNEKLIQLIELGAGKGTLMSDILRTIKNFPEIYSKLRIVIVDVNKELIKKQKETLKEHLNLIEWKNDLSNLSQFPSIFFCNEFFDALPIEQFIFSDNSWCERVIKLDGNDRLCFGALKTDNSKRITSINQHKSGDIIEKNDAAVAVMHQICNQISNFRGLFITFDYGYMNNSFNDTLQALKKHKYIDVLECPGEADLTSYVDFSSLVRCAEEHKLENVYFYDQGKFLELMGIRERAEALSKVNKKVEVDLKRLVDKNQMGEIFKCLLVEKF